uniref:Uncharacterized protein n=1 Tax=Dunaliella tertiolecta TaxID=3047 RepID=A0A7S3VJ72_DUNTE
MPVYLQIDSTDGVRVVKASCDKDLSFFQARVENHLSALGIDLRQAGVSFQYRAQDGDTIELELEDAHAAARIGGEELIACVVENGVSVLKIAMTVPRARTLTPRTLTPRRLTQEEGAQSGSIQTGGETAMLQSKSTDIFHQAILMDFWPLKKLPTTFSYNGKQFTYDPEQCGGPVSVFCNKEEAEQVSKNVAMGFPCVKTCMVLLQQAWYKNNFPNESPASQETFKGDMTKLYQQAAGSARNMTASIERKLAYDLGYKPPAGSKQTCPNGTAWMERQVQLRHRFTARMPYSAQSRPPFEKCKDIMSPLSLEAYTDVKNTLTIMKQKVPKLTSAPWNGQGRSRSATPTSLVPQASSAGSMEHGSRSEQVPPSNQADNLAAPVPPSNQADAAPQVPPSNQADAAPQVPPSNQVDNLAAPDDEDVTQPSSGEPQPNGLL